MDADALEKMDEFFDFDALDEDAGVGPMCRTEEDKHKTSFLTDHLANMDWAADPTATTSYLDLDGLPDIHGFDAPLKSSTDQDNQQWTNFNYAEQLILPMEDAPVTTRADSKWQADTRTPGMDHIVHCDEPISALAPSSSLVISAASAVRRDDHEGDLDTMDVRLVSSPPPHGQSTTGTTTLLDVGLPSTRPAAPLRQASTASWKPASAKRKGAQSRIPLEAKQILEDEFAANPYPHNWEMDVIAHQANLDVKKVRNWFNNTRARKKGGGERLLVSVIASFAYLYRSSTCRARRVRS